MLKTLKSFSSILLLNSISFCSLKSSCKVKEVHRNGRNETLPTIPQTVFGKILFVINNEIKFFIKTTKKD